MTDENETKVEVVETTTEQTDELTNVGEVNKDTETIPVDLWGSTINLPVAQAKEIIEKRQSRSKAYNDLSEKVKTFEAEKKDLERRLQASEAAKKGDVAEAEMLFNQKLEEKVSKYKDKVVKGELLNHLTSNEKFLDTPSSREDALTLLTTIHKFELDDNNEIVAGDKKVKEVVDSFVDTREAFQRTSKEPRNIRDPKKIVVKTTPNFKSAVGGFLNKLEGS